LSKSSESDLSITDSNDAGNGSKIEADENVLCFYCDEKFLQDRKRENWVQCMICKLWCHELCVGNIGGNSLPYLGGLSPSNKTDWWWGGQQKAIRFISISYKKQKKTNK